MKLYILLNSNERYCSATSLGYYTAAMYIKFVDKYAEADFTLTKHCKYILL